METSWIVIRTFNKKLHCSRLGGCWFASIISRIAKPNIVQLQAAHLIQWVPIDCKVCIGPDRFRASSGIIDQVTIVVPIYLLCMTRTRAGGARVRPRNWGAGRCKAWQVLLTVLMGSERRQYIASELNISTNWIVIVLALFYMSSSRYELLVSQVDCVGLLVCSVRRNKMGTMKKVSG